MLLNGRLAQDAHTIQTRRPASCRTSAPDRTTPPAVSTTRWPTTATSCGERPNYTSKSYRKSICPVTCTPPYRACASARRNWRAKVGITTLLGSYTYSCRVTRDKSKRLTFTMWFLPHARTEACIMYWSSAHPQRQACVVGLLCRACVVMFPVCTFPKCYFHSISIDSTTWSRHSLLQEWSQHWFGQG